MNNMEFVRLMDIKPSGLIPQLRFFEYHKSNLMESGDSEEIVKLINQEIELITHKISRYQKAHDELKVSIGEIETKLPDLLKDFAKVSSELNTNANFTTILAVIALPTASAFSIIAGFKIIGFALFCLALLIVNGKREILFALHRGGKLKRKISTLNAELNRYKYQMQALDEEIHFTMKIIEKPQKAPGIHSENIDWVTSKFLEIERNHPDLSENKRYQIFKKDYEAQFPKKAPGKTTVLRYLGRAD
jgi:chaperonin cofactor prefoldin